VLFEIFIIKSGRIFPENKETLIKEMLNWNQMHDIFQEADNA